jgi:hypothetical protein
MKLMSVLSGKGFVMYNKELAHSVSVNGSIIFGQLCSSYTSFGSKGMLTARDGKEYFFLTIETLAQETALSYKQQMKAVKDLEEDGYIETRNMGVPQKRHFHITDKIVNELLSSSDKREELNIPPNIEPSETVGTPRLAKRERLDLPKGEDNNCQKVSNIKKKNKKEQYKDNNNFNCNYKELSIYEFKILLTDSCNSQYNKFSIGRYSKKQWNTLIETFVNDTIVSGRWRSVPEDKIEGFAFKCLERIVDNSDYKNGDFQDYKKVMEKLSTREASPYNKTLSYNWLEGAE